MTGYPDWVITTCGGKKLDGPAPASRLYRGPFAQKQMRVARSLAPAKHLILSNVHGYMRPDHVITRYDSHWGYPDTMPDEELRRQIATHGFAPGHRVLHLGAKVYSAQSVRLMPSGVEVYWLPALLPDTRIGYQSSFYSEVIARGLPPDWTRTRIR